MRSVYPGSRHTLTGWSGAALHYAFHRPTLYLRNAGLDRYVPPRDSKNGAAIYWLGSVLDFDIARLPTDGWAELRRWVPTL